MNNIIGIWQSDPDDKVAQREFGMTTIEFKQNGELIHTIYESDKMQKSLLTYEIKGN